MRGFKYVKRSDMRVAFDTLQVPLPGTPQAYKRDLEAKRKRSTACWIHRVQQAEWLRVVPSRVLLLPVPGIGAHILQGALGAPVEEPAALFRVGIADGDVTGAARTDPMGQF